MNNEGWGKPPISSKWHYFVKYKSLCGRWSNFHGKLDSDNESNLNCAICKKMQHSKMGNSPYKPLGDKVKTEKLFAENSNYEK